MNELERKVHDALVQRGHTVLRAGWPDFLVLTKNRGYALEVKSTKDKLSPAQRAMHLALAQFGIAVHVLRDEDCSRRGRMVILPEHLYADHLQLVNLQFKVKELEHQVEALLHAHEGTTALMTESSIPPPPGFPAQFARLADEKGVIG